LAYDRRAGDLIAEAIMVIDGMARHAVIRVLEEIGLGEPASVAGDLLAALDAAGYQLVPKAARATKEAAAQVVTSLCNDPAVWLNRVGERKLGIIQRRIEDALDNVSAPDGWQIVPKEPTAAMRQAGAAPWTIDARIVPNAPLTAPAIYRAMLAAAPKPE
jgi:hypothetical protein